MTSHNGQGSYLRISSHRLSGILVSLLSLWQDNGQEEEPIRGNEWSQWLSKSTLQSCKAWRLNASDLHAQCCGWYALSCCGLQCLIQLGTRGEIRNRYNIEGSGVKDFLATWCCPCCSLTQEYKELKAHDSMNVAGAAVGYQSQPAGGMTYAAPPVQGKVG